MFIPKKVVEWFTELKEDSRTQAEIANTALGHLREELTRLHADVQAKSQQVLALKTQAATDHANFDWMKLKVNQLEYERASLLKKFVDLDVSTRTDRLSLSEGTFPFRAASGVMLSPRSFVPPRADNAVTISAAV